MKKYSIDDLLFDYDFMPAEVPEEKAELTHEIVLGLPWSETGKYRFFYRNVWKVIPAKPERVDYKHPGIDMRFVDGGPGREERIIRYFERLAQDMAKRERK